MYGTWYLVLAYRWEEEESSRHQPAAGRVALQFPIIIINNNNNNNNNISKSSSLTIMLTSSATTNDEKRKSAVPNAAIDTQEFIKTSRHQAAHLAKDEAFERSLQAAAQEMNDLTFEERERVFEEVHGVSGIVEETPELIATSLAQMREELVRAPRRSRRAFDLARNLSPALAHDDSFHLMFLRAERFDPSKAAAKMVRHYEHKLQLFGDAKLAKTITLQDLEEYDTTDDDNIDIDDIDDAGGGADAGRRRTSAMDHVRSGFLQLPVVNNRGGRAVAVVIAAVKDFDVKPFMRYFWYQLMTVICEDENVQKQGIVTVNYCTGEEWHQPIGKAIEFVSKTYQMLYDWPVRVCGHHYCYDRPDVINFLRIMHTLQGKEFRLHNRMHYGSEQEIQYSLLSFGIRSPPPPPPPSSLKENNSFQLGKQVWTREQMEHYIQKRRTIDEKVEQREIYDRDGSKERPFLFPSVNDVLMGRGKPYQDWHGNLRLAQILWDHIDEYILAVNRVDKTTMALVFVQMIQQKGKFLERTENGWLVVDDTLAKAKVSQILRTLARKKQDGTFGVGSGGGGIGFGIGIGIDIGDLVPGGEALSLDDDVGVLDPEEELSDFSGQAKRTRRMI